LVGLVEGVQGGRPLAQQPRSLPERPFLLAQALAVRSSAWSMASCR